MAYKEFVFSAIKAKEKRGARSELAKSIGCHLAYVSQVLEGKSHFTIEQGEAFCRYIGLSQIETDFFINLLSFERAGTQSLRQYYQGKIEGIRQERMQFASRVQVKRELSANEESTYYSSWIYIAIFVLVSIPEFQNKEALAKRLGLTLEIVNEHLDFLLSVGIVKQVVDRFMVGTTRMHLPSKSPLISKHHTNWRMKAITSLENRKKQNLHFSTVYTFSRQDSDKIKKMLLDFVQSVEPIVMPSAEEIAYCLSFDFFEIYRIFIVLRG